MSIKNRVAKLEQNHAPEFHIVFQVSDYETEQEAKETYCVEHNLDLVNTNLLVISKEDAATF